MFGRKNVAMLVAEFLGTAILTLVVLAVQRSTIGVPYFVGLGAGLTIIALMLVLGNVSGAQLNPAVTIALWTARKIKTVPAVGYIIVQLLGGWAAYGIYSYFVNNSLPKIGGDFTARVLIAEAIGAFILAFVWAAVVAQKHVNTVVASAVGIAFALGLIVSASASIGLINPALALGTRAWGIWGSMGWGTYVLGPVVGAVVGVNLYNLLFTDMVWVDKAVPARATAATTTTTSRRTATKRKTSSRKR
jgi:glycerol uptake facilitator protein